MSKKPEANERQPATAEIIDQAIAAGKAIIADGSQKLMPR